MRRGLTPLFIGIVIIVNFIIAMIIWPKLKELRPRFKPEPCNCKCK